MFEVSAFEPNRVTSMDLTPLVPVMIGILTAVATLGGVWITQASTERREKQRRAEEREDRGVADLRTEARKVSDLFLAESIALERIQKETRETGDFAQKYEAHLYSESLYRLSQAVSMMPNAEARSQILLVLRNLVDQTAFPREIGIPWEFLVGILIGAGSELSSAYARGEKPDLDQVHRFRQIERADASVSAKIANARIDAEKNYRLEGRRTT